MEMEQRGFEDDMLMSSSDLKSIHVKKGGKKGEEEVCLSIYSGGMEAGRCWSGSARRRLDGALESPLLVK